MKDDHRNENDVLRTGRACVATARALETAQTAGPNDEKMTTRTTDTNTNLEKNGALR